MIWAHDDFGPVLEGDTGHDLRQLVFARQAPPPSRPAGLTGSPTAPSG